MTKKLIFAVTLMIALAFGILPADATGKWTAQVPGRQGAMMERIFTFKAEGATLSGSMTGPGGMEIPITEGKVAGDTISFVTSFDRGGNVIKQTYTGAVAGEEIKFKMEGGRGGPQEFVAKKAK